MSPTDRVIVFDTDGTLMDGRHAVIDAVAEALEITYRHFELPVAEPDRERIGLAMGLPASVFFRTAFNPTTVPGDLRNAFVAEFEVQSTRAEVAALRSGGSRLYEGAEETLSILRNRGFTLALFSNAGDSYFQTVIEVHGLDRWFTRTLSLEYAVRRRLARNKTGMVRHLSDGHSDVVVVGDRVHDIEAGRTLGAKTVACRYGFGELAELGEADWQVDAPKEILDLPVAMARARG